MGVLGTVELVGVLGAGRGVVLEGILRCWWGCWGVSGVLGAGGGAEVLLGVAGCWKCC